MLPACFAMTFLYIPGKSWVSYPPEVFSMKLREIMTAQVVRIRPEEPVGVAARLLTQYNIGALPVCGQDGTLRGLVTDRDIVTRCLAPGRDPKKTRVADIMSSQVLYARPDMEAAVAAHYMGRQQIRRLPVVENGRLCGMVSLCDLASREETAIEAGDALSQIGETLSSR